MLDIDRADISLMVRYGAFILYTELQSSSSRPASMYGHVYVHIHGRAHTLFGRYRLGAHLF